MDKLPFFVYGTLLPGQPNDYLWQDSISDATPATFSNGRIYSLGTYPILVEEEGGTVQGMVVSVAPDAYAAILQCLDQLERFDPAKPEDSAYLRRKRTVRLLDGQSVVAWLYLGHPETVSGAPLIDSGDWSAYARSAFAEISAWWASMGLKLRDGTESDL